MANSPPLFGDEFEGLLPPTCFWPTCRHFIAPERYVWNRCRSWVCGL